jgi:pimeloyl-ACP methyl ester carboxylesterase
MREWTLDTDRIRMHVLESGPEDGVPVVLVHGNLATGRFFAHLLERAPIRYRLIAPDMRGFGDSEPAPLDATRGLGDWADDLHALLAALGIERPPHLAGWSTGGAAIAGYALEHPVASLTLIDPVPPYGYGGTFADGTPCWEDYAGSGAGATDPDFVERLAAGDRTADAATSPRNVLNGAYWRAGHREERENELLDEVLKSLVGDDGYPGDWIKSENWPGFAPGTRGILNALSPKYCNWSALAGIADKPPLLWTHGARDVVVADGSPWEMGKLGSLGLVGGWPGEDAFPPQPMITQIRELVERYGDDGGRAVAEIFEDSGHAPFIDASARWSAVFFGFLESAR